VRKLHRRVWRTAATRPAHPLLLNTNENRS
jgi:hypothetical protein